MVEETTEEVKAHLLRFDVHTPQGEITQPEGFVSSLVELLYELKYEPFKDDNEGKKIATFYRTKRGDTKGMRVFPLDPFEKNSKPEPEDLEEKLDEFFVLGRDQAKKRKTAHAIANSIVGIEINKTETRLAVPLGKGLAAIQNDRGIGGHHNPWNIGEAITEFYEIGYLSASKVEREVNFSPPQERWLRSAEWRTSEDAVLGGIDASFTSLYHGALTKKPDTGTADRYLPRRFGEINPFLWFVRTWDNLNNDAWVKALPARQWTDWATAVLRLALGLGNLWIIRWYSEIAKSILLSDEQTDWTELLKRVDSTPLIPWIPSTQKITERNVWPDLNKQILRYTDLRVALKNALEALTDKETTVEEFFKLSSANQNVREDFEMAMQSEKSKQARDFVRYALQARQEENINADYYGLLKRRGGKLNAQYTIVEPGTELIAVIASLNSEEPSSETSLKQVTQSLRLLGLKWDRKELIQLLQEAGLVKGSPDADEGVIVRTAY